MTAVTWQARAWRWGSVAFFCGLPLLIVLAIGTDLMEAADANDVAARQNAMLSQIVGKLAKRTRRDLTADEKASLYLASASATLARGEIHDRAIKLVDQAGGHLVEAQLPGTAEQESEGTIEIQLTFDIDNKGLFDLLYATETGLPLLKVMTLNIATNQGTETAAAASAMRVEMTVQGHFRKTPD